MQGAPRLKLVAIAAAGMDNDDVEEARRLGIDVHNAPDYGSESVAEHAIAILFALRRELLTYTTAAVDGRWQVSPHFCWSGPAIRHIGGTVFGVVGRGRIGEAVARFARGLGMRVLFTAKPGAVPRPDEVPLDILLSQCDALCLHVPLTSETKGLINERTLGPMKRDAVLINTGQGALVNASALTEALQQRGHCGRSD